jgi:hypothetical protein
MGLALDFGYFYRDKRIMQTAADAGALAGASEVYRNKSTLIASSARAGTVSNGFTDGTDNVLVTVNNPPASGYYTGNSQFVEVILSQDVPANFIRIFGVNSVNIGARAVAGVGASGRACIYALNPTTNNALVASGGAVIDVKCGIVVDSNGTQAMVASGPSCVTATGVSITGNFTQGSCAISPAPDTAVPPVPDPLGYLQPPTYGACNYTNFKVGGGTATLSPGVYCGGITVSGGGAATFNPGTYILYGGGLTASGGSSLYGIGVTFYNTAGPGFAYKPITISGTSGITLTAPTTEPLSGILFFQDRAIVSSSKNTISGTSSSRIEGALYFPTTPLVYSGGSTGASKYMFIVADTIEFSGASSLVGGDYSGLPGGSPIKRISLVE